MKALSEYALVVSVKSRTGRQGENNEGVSMERSPIPHSIRPITTELNM
jgi:hypothetical protein